MTIFEKIIKKEIPSYVIYEDELIYSFLDANPHNEGHILVTPKEPYETLSDIPDSVLQHLILIVKKIAINTKEVLNADGYNICMNNGEDANQVVPHAHFHIIPRFKDDKDIYSHKKGPDLSPEEFKEIQERLSL